MDVKKQHLDWISRELNIQNKQVEAVARLLSEGATIPFIARYRKEVTGSLDEVAVASIRDRLSQLQELDARREVILRSIEDQGKLTDELRAAIENADTMAALEDLYLPYRPKRRTRASMAREKGLEPLAQYIFLQNQPEAFHEETIKCLNAEKGVDSEEAALAGARDIIAEWISEDSGIRGAIRTLFLEEGIIQSRVVPGREDEGAKFRDYFEWQEPAASAPSHRVLAMRRGESENCLSLRILPPENKALNLIESAFVTDANVLSDQVRLAAHDSYKRLLLPSMETEVRNHLKDRADSAAIVIFAQNLRQLLLSPPLGQKSILALDPGYRTGCKAVCLNRQGKLLHYEAVFPRFSGGSDEQAGNRIRSLVSQFGIEAVAIGNGTASRETEAFVQSLGIGRHIPVIVVNESGASVYSASEVAREEFPDHDVTVRGAVSIGRRLMDPLAELVKIDPKSIGVGQYQHDVDQGALKKSLDEVVVSCVNNVGVEVNTASRELLQYVSGLGPQLARNIVEYRNQNGPFQSREELKKIPRLGPKAFEQSAGFIRISGASNPLDASAVHPESYHIVRKMASDLGISVSQMMSDPGLRKKILIQNYVSDTIGLPTLRDILAEIEKPGRDPRDPFETMTFSEEVRSIEDLKPGMSLPGIVTNITAFGVFVDIGVHQDGLVHISQLSDRFVKNPSDVVKVQQKVTVTVLTVDLERKRISLSMRQSAPQSGNTEPPPFSNNPFAKAFGKKGR